MIKKILPLTEEENKALAYIYGYIDENGYSPTRTEMAEFLECSTQGADYFINQLKKKGKIKTNGKKWRNISIVDRT
ncbi:MAG: hypothetical protein WC737_05550 [Parcubacteria group bacterium]|jgi:SOS-response transcriptional repressor LexA